MKKYKEPELTIAGMKQVGMKLTHVESHKFYHPEHKVPEDILKRFFGVSSAPLFKKNFLKKGFSVGGILRNHTFICAKCARAGFFLCGTLVFEGPRDMVLSTAEVKTSEGPKGGLWWHCANGCNLTK